jgi:hypothetical protein
MASAMALKRVPDEFREAEDSSTAFSKHTFRRMLLGSKN